MDKDATPQRRWTIARSIAIELDVAGYFVRMGPDALPKALAGLADLVPAAWFDEFDSLSPVSSADKGLQSIVEPIARWSKVLYVEDYDTASAAMREMTAGDAIAQAVSSFGVEPQTGLDEAE